MYIVVDTTQNYDETSSSQLRNLLFIGSPNAKKNLFNLGTLQKTVLFVTFLFSSSICICSFSFLLLFFFLFIYLSLSLFFFFFCFHFSSFFLCIGSVRYYKCYPSSCLLNYYVKHDYDTQLAGIIVFNMFER